VAVGRFSSFITKRKLNFSIRLEVPLYEEVQFRIIGFDNVSGIWCLIWLALACLVTDFTTVKTQIIGRCATSPQLPPLARSDVFCSFTTPKGAEQLCILRPFSEVGNSRLHSTPTDYLSPHGTPDPPKGYGMGSVWNTQIWRLYGGKNSARSSKALTRLRVRSLSPNFSRILLPF